MSDVSRLLEVMARLRDPQGGCPWDREQNFATIAPYTIEEAYEVADAIERGDMDELRDELGDLMFQVAFHARMAEEQGLFAFNDVIDAIVEKMIRRHPHVFGDAEVADAEAQTAAWEQHKAKEREAKADASLMAGVTKGLPALSRALKLQKRAGRAGFDWSATEEVLGKLDEEIEELRHELGTGNEAAITDEIGDLLFTCVNLARHAGVDPEGALRHANTKFERRFRAMETVLNEMGSDIEQADAVQLDQAWESVKASE